MIFFGNAHFQTRSIISCWIRHVKQGFDDFSFGVFGTQIGVDQERWNEWRIIN